MKISRLLATCMVNNDYSGLNREEVELVKDFPDFTVLDWYDDSNDINGICRITGEYDRVIEISII